MWAYPYMKGWKESELSEHIDFDFHDAHDLRHLTYRASEETVPERLRQRFASSKQAIVLVGESTRFLYRFVCWEIEVALKLGIPIVAVNLNGRREYDAERCPPSFRDEYVVQVPFKAKIIQYALAACGKSPRWPSNLVVFRGDSRGRFSATEFHHRLLDRFSAEHSDRGPDASGSRRYSDSVYARLDL